MKIIDMRKIITLAVVVATLLSSAIGAQAQQRRQVMLDKVVAVVGGSSILSLRGSGVCRGSRYAAPTDGLYL